MATTIPAPEMTLYEARRHMNNLALAYNDTSQKAWAIVDKALSDRTAEAEEMRARMLEREATIARLEEAAGLTVTKGKAR